MDNLTPMMKQYMSVKSKHKDCILFFRLGDFYEMFFEDAITASKELEITLTKRDCGQKEKAPMCGVPYHAADTYIPKLIEKGYKVAICEQLEDPATAKGIVKRDVIRIITPGTMTDSKALDEKTNNYLASIFMDDEGVGISYVDISTGELYTTEFNGDIRSNGIALLDELGKIVPTEMIVNSIVYNNERLMKTIENKINPYIEKYDDENINYDDSRDSITKYFYERSAEIFKDIDGKLYSVVSTGILLNYLQDTQKMIMNHINHVSYYSIKNYMILDLNTRINLEINETIRGNEKRGSLIWLLDKTSTAMGGRLLKRWLEQPLLNIEDIEYRLDIIETFTENIILMDEIKGYLKDIYDLERIMGKIAYGNCNARDLIFLKNSIQILPDLKEKLTMSSNVNLVQLGQSMDPLKDLYILIDDSIIDDPPITIKEGGIIKSNFNCEISELKEISMNGKKWLASLEDLEKQKTGIKSLKIGYNKVFGYYIDVTKSYLDLVPDNYMRKQTLSNSERYITPELKEMEAKILGAEEKLVDLEYEVFIQIRDKIKDEIERVQSVSKIVAQIDALNSLSQVAYNNNYTRPELNNDGIIEIKDGKHPVVEKMLKDIPFVPNDTYLNRDNQRVLIITGPNMAGKSTYMRQVAIITLMAQVGSFVPAKYANIGVADRIFTRIGASDNLSQGESTFMVEMNEVSNIIQNATKDSLIILDEVGRGTSTFDGLSIAWSVIEYIAKKIKAKTLFATHYHELTQLEGDMEGVVNYNVLVEEKGEEIIFLRKIVKGSTDRSYGIEVARLAGINGLIIKRAKEILKHIESQQNGDIKIKEPDNSMRKENKLEQINLFDLNNRSFVDKIKDIDVIKLTPMETMNILYDLVEEARNL